MKKIFFFCILLIFIINLFSEQCIKILSEVGNIRYSNSLNSQIICEAKRNDLFIFKAKVGDWYKIYLCSADYRYVHSSIAKKVDIDLEPYSKNISDYEVKKIAAEVINNETLSYRLSDTYFDPNKYPEKNLDYYKKMLDYLILEMYHTKNITPALHVKIMARFFNM